MSFSAVARTSSTVAEAVASAALMHSPYVIFLSFINLYSRARWRAARIVIYPAFERVSSGRSRTRVMPERRGVLCERVLEPLLSARADLHLPDLYPGALY